MLGVAGWVCTALPAIVCFGRRTSENSTPVSSPQPWPSRKTASTTAAATDTAEMTFVRPRHYLASIRRRLASAVGFTTPL